MKLAFAACLLLLLSTPLFSQGAKPKEGYVPDSRTAVKIAKAALIPVFSENLIQSERPFTAKLENGVWIVAGTLPAGFNGGVAKVKISKADAQIVAMWREQ